LSSFAPPVDSFQPVEVRPDASDAPSLHPEPATHVAGGCPAAPDASFDREAAVSRAAGYFHAHRSSLTDREIARVAEVVVDCARHHELDPKLVVAVIHVESRGNAYAVSRVGAMGLMQIMPTTGEELAGELGIQWVGAKQLFDPEVNVQLGVAYLRQLRQQFGNWSTALAAYNWGPGQIAQRLRKGVALPVVYSSSVLAAKTDDV